MLVKQGPVKFTRAPPLFRHKPVRMKDFRKLPKEIQAELKEDIESLHDRMFQVMRDMPSSLLFIFRYCDIQWFYCYMLGLVVSSKTHLTFMQLLDER